MMSLSAFKWPPAFLAAVFFGCRPCSLFDTRVKLDQHLGELDDDLDR